MTKQQEDFLENTQKQIAFCDEEIYRIDRRIRDGDSLYAESEKLVEMEGYVGYSGMSEELFYQIDSRDQLIEQLRYKLHNTESIMNLYRTTK
jgi:hypothetical protein